MGGMRTYAKFDLDTMYQEIYNQHEKLIIGRILMLLGDFIVLETSMLYKAYQQKYGENIEMDKLKKSVKDFLTIEYKYNLYHKTEKKLFFYTLKMNGGDYLLKAGGYDFSMPSYFWSAREYSIMLTFNKYFLENGLFEKVHKAFVSYLEKGIFLSKDLNKVYFLTLLAEREAVEAILSRFTHPMTKETLSEIVDYVPIETTSLEDFGELTSAVDPKDINIK